MSLPFPTAWPPWLTSVFFFFFHSWSPLDLLHLHLSVCSQSAATTGTQSLQEEELKPMLSADSCYTQNGLLHHEYTGASWMSEDLTQQVQEVHKYFKNWWCTQILRRQTCIFMHSVCNLGSNMIIVKLYIIIFIPQHKESSLVQSNGLQFQPTEKHLLHRKIMSQLKP